MILEFKLTGAYIELAKLLKITNIAESGGQAKMMIGDRLVSVNGQIEERKKAKLYPGDIVFIECLGTEIGIK